MPVKDLDFYGCAFELDHFKHHVWKNDVESNENGVSQKIIEIEQQWDKYKQRILLVRCFSYIHAYFLPQADLDCFSGEKLYRCQACHSTFDRKSLLQGPILQNSISAGKF
jgi:hypothetical protein